MFVLCKLQHLLKCKYQKLKVHHKTGISTGTKLRSGKWQQMAKVKMHHLFLIEGWYSQDYFCIHVTGWFTPSLEDIHMTVHCQSIQQVNRWLFLSSIHWLLLLPQSCAMELVTPQTTAGWSSKHRKHRNGSSVSSQQHTSVVPRR